MATTQVDIQGMIAARGAFQNAVEENTRSYSQVSGQLDALMAVWKGDASTTFQGGMREWQASFARANSALQEMETTLESNINVYQQTHHVTNENASRVANNMSGLPNFQI